MLCFACASFLRLSHYIKSIFSMIDNNCLIFILGFYDSLRDFLFFYRNKNILAVRPTGFDI